MPRKKAGGLTLLTIIYRFKGKDMPTVLRRAAGTDDEELVYCAAGCFYTNSDHDEHHRFDIGELTDSNWEYQQEEWVRA